MKEPSVNWERQMHRLETTENVVQTATSELGIKPNVVFRFIQQSSCIPLNPLALDRR